MGLTEIYEKGEAAIRSKEIGLLLDAVETGFIPAHDRSILDRFTFRQCCIDAAEPSTDCQVLGVSLATPVIMSAMTMPIPVLAENGLAAVAEGLKQAGSLMWTGTPIPQNLRELAQIGVPLAANVKPLADRKKLFETLDEIQEAGVDWVGIEIDAGLGTKIRDRQIASDCAPLAFKDLEEIRRAVAKPLVFKGVLSGIDAQKSVDAGADGIFVSNHGAHTLDYLPHPIQVMDEILRAVGDNTAIIVDGGIRRGSDVMKALAFGAHLVGLGRPILYGLAAAGKEGVRDVVAELTAELRRIMTLVGAASPRQAHRAMLVEDP